MSVPVPAYAPAQLPPAIGRGGSLSGRAKLGRLLTALALVVLLAGLRVVVSAAGRQSELPPLSGAARVSAGLLRGGGPDDEDLTRLADLNVRGVVNIAGANVTEKAVVTSLQQGYLEAPVAVGEAPTWSQLEQIATFLAGYTKVGKVVYLHDDDGTGRALVTTSMLRLLRGDPAQRVIDTLSQREFRSLSLSQLLALRDLSARLSGTTPAGSTGTYAAARLIRW